MIIWDFSLPFFRMKRRGLYIDQFNSFCKGAPSQYKKKKKKIESPNNRMGYIVPWFNYVEDDIILDEEKVMKKFTLIQQRLNLFTVIRTETRSEPTVFSL